MIRQSTKAFAALLYATLLISCGGGSGAQAPVAALDAGTERATALAVNAATGSADDPLITNYQLVSSTRVSRTVFDYRYRLSLQVTANSFPTGAVLTVTSNATSTTVQDATVNTAPLVAFSVDMPTDTFTIRQDRTVAFDPTVLTWTIDAKQVATSGLKTIESAGLTREYYLDLPSDYDRTGPPRPLIIGYHGTGGKWQAWLNDYKLKETAVGDGAILIYPDALPNGAGVKQWDFTNDFQMFEDLLAQLPAEIAFDPNRILVTGHSSGGGFAHEIGCRYGDRIRAIAPVAGSLTATSCVGSVAVLQIQGETDSLVPLSLAELGHNFWVLYNGFDLPVSAPGIQPPCIDHSLGASAWPVQWCLHQEGSGVTAHAWPSFANAAIWNFFRSLPDAAPRFEAPPGGGNARVLASADTTLSFTLRYPSGIAQPTKGVAVLVPFGSRQPLTDAPIAFLNLNFAPGAIGGDVRSYQIPVQFRDASGALTFPGDYAIEIVIYVEGGGFPIPAAGLDHVVLIDVNIPDRVTPIVLPGVLDLEASRNPF